MPEDDSSVCCCRQIKPSLIGKLRIAQNVLTTEHIIISSCLKIYKLNTQNVAVNVQTCSSLFWFSVIVLYHVKHVSDAWLTTAFNKPELIKKHSHKFTELHICQPLNLSLCMCICHIACCYHENHIAKYLHMTWYSKITEMLRATLNVSNIKLHVVS